MGGEGSWNHMILNRTSNRGACDSLGSPGAQGPLSLCSWTNHRLCLPVEGRLPWGGALWEDSPGDWGGLRLGHQGQNHCQWSKDSFHCNDPVILNSPCGYTRDENVESQVRTRCRLSQSLDHAGRYLKLVRCKSSAKLFSLLFYVALFQGEVFPFEQPASMCQDKETSCMSIQSSLCNFLFHILAVIFAEMKNRPLSTYGDGWTWIENTNL